MELNILYEDKDILVCVKPAGVPSQSDKSFDTDMVSAILARERNNNEALYCAVINRLDKPVSGIMLFAKNKKTAGLLSCNAEYTKKYKAIVRGSLKDNEGIMEDYLVKDGKTNTSRVVDSNVAGAKKAALKYSVSERFFYEGIEYSLVDIELLTGRHHQIRVQFASRQTPLYGDRKYGNANDIVRGDNIALCAYELSFYHPVLKKNMKYNILPSGGMFDRRGNGGNI